MRKMVIGTFNMQNKYFVKHYDGMNQQNNPKLFCRLLKTYHIDTLGTQELVAGYIENLKKTIPSDYQIVGKFRFSTNLLKKFNETNSIITKDKILQTKTFKLPFLPTFTPRIVTQAEIELKNGKTICFLNTHLALANRWAQKRQLKALEHLIQQNNLPIVLTGDFNMTIYNPLFKDFIKRLEQYHLKRVPIFNKTYDSHTKERAIDHIFIPDDWQVNTIQIIKDTALYKMSDHYLVLADVSLPER